MTSVCSVNSVSESVCPPELSIIRPMF